MLLQLDQSALESLGGRGLIKHLCGLEISFDHAIKIKFRTYVDRNHAPSLSFS